MFHNLLGPDKRGLELIDWDQLATQLATSVHFEIVERNLTKAPDFHEQSWIESAFDDLDWGINSLEKLESQFDNYVRKLPSEIKYYLFLTTLKKAQVPDFNDINCACLMMEVAWEMGRDSKGLPPSFAKSQSFSGLDRAFSKIVTPFRKFVTSDGEIHYERHPVLGPLKAQIHGMETILRQTITRLAKGELYGNALQMDTYDILHDRYVLPIRSDSYKAAMGAIVSRSTSGHTLYVEPFELRELSNQRLQLVAKLEEEIYRICLQYGQLLGEQINLLDSIQVLLILFDEIRCKARFSTKLQLIRPLIVQNENMLYLENFFHPLVQNPIKNDIYVKKDDLGLILSGPNTGGKTVALKAMCLSLLFIHKGLFVPATQASIPLCQGIFFFGHDQQNLGQGLSSFSAEVENYLLNLDELQEKNFIFIDEIFNSTGSDEASALACELFNEIHKRSDSKVFVSTHHHLLKVLMHANKSYISGHVGIDLEQRRPTYKLILDGPGSSHAFSIFESVAARLGKSDELAKKGKELLGRGQRPYEQLLEEVSNKNVQLDSELTKVKNLKQELLNQKMAQEGILRLKTDEKIKEMHKRLEKYEKDAQKVIEDLKYGKLGKRTAFDSLKGIERSLDNERAEQFDFKNEEKIAFVPIKQNESLTIGSRLYSRTYKQNVEVVSDVNRKGEVMVKLGKLKVLHPLKDLGNNENVNTDKKVNQERISIHIDRISRSNIELDGRGMRLEEFQLEVERALMDLYAGDIPFLLIIHGHGDGVLKKWTRECLNSRKEFSWRSEEGNDGATHVELVK